MAVFDLRGTHGSGKSHVMHSLLAQFAHSVTRIEVMKPSGAYRHIGYDFTLGSPPKAVEHQKKVFILGSYERVCGGCDGIKTQDEICDLVRLYSKVYDAVLLEGILVAHNFSRYAKLADEVGRRGCQYNFLFFDTPLKKCIQRVEERRQKAGNDKPLDPKNVIKDWHCIHQKLPLKFKRAGYNVITIPWQEPVSSVIRLIKGHSL